MINVQTTNNNSTYNNSYVNREGTKEIYRGEVKRGDIFWVNLDGFVTGNNSLQKGRHMVIVVSNEMCNSRSSIISGVSFTSQMKNRLPTHVYFNKGNFGLTKDSTVLCEQIISLDKKYILEYVGHVSEDKMNEIDEAMGVQLQIKPKTITPVKEVCNDIERIKKAKRLLHAIQQTDNFILKYEPRKIEEVLKKREMEIAEFKIYCKDQNINYSKNYDEIYFTHKINMLYRETKVMMG